MRRDAFITFSVLLLLAAVALAGCGGNKKGSKTAVTTEPGSTQPVSEQSTGPVTPPQYSPQGNTLTGTGSAETDTYMVGNQPIKVAVVHTGSEPGFEVVMVNFLTKAETPVVTVVAETSYNGSKMLMVPAGTYTFRVKASGPWTITIDQ